MREIEKRCLVKFFSVGRSPVNGENYFVPVHECRARRRFAAKMRHHSRHDYLFDVQLPQCSIQRCFVESIVLCLHDDVRWVFRIWRDHSAHGILHRDHFIPPSRHLPCIFRSVDMSREDDRIGTLGTSVVELRDRGDDRLRRWNECMGIAMKKIVLHIENEQRNASGLQQQFARTK